MQTERYDLIAKIKKDYPKLSKGQKIIAQYIISNLDKVSFMTASKLASLVGVSESTVVRFANSIGFSGYTEFQKNLQEIIKTKLTTVQRVDMTNDYSNDFDNIKNVLMSDIDNIKTTLENIDPVEFNKMIDKILSARKIYIVGLRSSTTLSEYLAFYLNFILDNVMIVNYGVSDVFEQILNVSTEDLVIGISFPRYSKRTYDILEYAKNQNASIIALTDSRQAPIAELTDSVLLAKSNMISFVDSLVAPFSVINALIVAIGMKKKDGIKKSFDKLEKVWKEYKIYDEK